MQIKIGSKVISKNSPVFIIAEAGVNHNGDFKLAKKLIDIAAQSGVDAIKFQTFRPDTLVTPKASKAKYQTKNDKTKETQHAMLKRLVLKREYHLGLKKYAERKGLTFLSTPFSHDDAEFLLKLGVKAIKVGSSDTENIPYLKKIAQFQLPIILSTGMSALKEVKESIKVIKQAGNNQIIILHCTTNYPTPYEEANLMTIKTLSEKTGLLTGLSDHTQGIEAAIAATALGAKVIEKHFTLSRKMPGPDHLSSLEPHELKSLVQSVRNVEKAMGTGKKIPFVSEKEIAAVARKSLVAARDIPSGKKLGNKDIVIKRPGTGIKPKLLPKMIGKQANQNIAKDKILNWDMFK